MTVVVAVVVVVVVVVGVPRDAHALRRHRHLVLEDPTGVRRDEQGADDEQELETFTGCRRWGVGGAGTYVFHGGGSCVC